MTFTFHCEPADGHVIAGCAEGNLLIDTGAPHSVCDGRITFAGQTYGAVNDFMGVNVRTLSGLVGLPIHALIGADILNRYDLTISVPERKLVLSEEEQAAAGEEIALDFFMGIPILDAAVDGRIIRMFFDTGARLSYLNPDIARAHPATGKKEDFHPGLGRFTTETHRVPVRLGSLSFDLTAGILPEILQSTLMMANTSGILGTAILTDHILTYASRRKK